MIIQTYIRSIVRPRLRDIVEDYLWQDEELISYMNTVRDAFYERCLLADNTGVYSGTVSVVFDATNKTITRSTGSFLADGFYVGQEIKTTSLTNPGPFEILTVTATVITVRETVVDEVATDYVVYDSIGAIQVTEDVSTYSRDARIVKVTRAKLVSRSEPLAIHYKNGIPLMDAEHQGWQDADSGIPQILLTQGVGKNRYRLWQTPNADDWLLLNCYRLPLKNLTDADSRTYNLDRDFPESIQRKMLNGILAQAYDKHDAETEDPQQVIKYQALHEKDIEDINQLQLKSDTDNVIVAPCSAFI